MSSLGARTSLLGARATERAGSSASTFAGSFSFAGVDAAARLARLRVVLAVAFACGLALSFPLWLASARDYPLAPAFDFLPQPRAPLDWLWLAALFALLAAVASARAPRKFAVAFLLAAGALALLDQSRWQPWFYQYFFMLAALCWHAPRAATDYDADVAERTRAGSFQGDGTRAALAACRMIVAATYFWAGAQKLNPGFRDVGAGLIGPFVPDALAGAGSAAFAFAVPLVEMLIGVGLLTRRFRRACVLAAVATHAVALLLLLPARHNTVVWPWNMAMAIFVVVLFRGDGETRLRDALAGGRTLLRAAVLALFVLLPALSFAGLWDAYLSSALYSGSTGRAFLRFGETVKERLPPRARRVVRAEKDGYVLSVGSWSMAELNVPAYPERRIFKRAARELCRRADAPGDVLLEIREPPKLWGLAPRTTTYDCAALASE